MKLSDKVCFETAQFWGNCLREQIPNIGDESPLMRSLREEGEFSELAKRVDMTRLQAVETDENKIKHFEGLLFAALLELNIDWNNPGFSYTLRIDYTDSEGNSPELLEACRLAGIDPQCLPWKTATYSSVYCGTQCRYRGGDRKDLS